LIAVLDYGIGNLRSAEKALQHLGADARLVSDPDEAAAAGAVVLPGVGAFGPCMEALVASGLDRVARQAVAGGVPFLGICVGMQLLYDGSEESPGVPGLGLIPGVVRRLPDGVKRPQMQWNRLLIRPWGPPCPLLTGPAFDGPGADPWVYFVHSFAPPIGDEIVASCDYGGPVAAVAARDAMWATQFHPEKSGATGLALLANFIAVAAGLASGASAPGSAVAVAGSAGGSIGGAPLGGESVGGGPLGGGPLGGGPLGGGPSAGRVRAE
jgi:glutamine amidotransferase